MAKKKKDPEAIRYEAQVEETAKMAGSVIDDGEGELKRPTLTGTSKQKPKREQPGTNNMSREDIGEQETEEKEEQ